MAGFTGFRPETFTFLAGLAFNNDRAWFESHRKDYEDFVVAPALALINEMDPLLRSLSPHYRGVPKKVGGSLMRIYRDTRFSRDKTPYKTNIGIQFRHESAGDVHAPGWYVHLDLESAFVGAGAWHPDPEALKRIREQITERPATYTKAVKASQASGMLLVGEALKKSPRGFDPGHELAAEVRRKDFLLSADLDPTLYMSHQLVGLLEEHFRATAPFMAWLCGSLGVAF